MLAKDTVTNDLKKVPNVIGYLLAKGAVTSVENAAIDEFTFVCGSKKKMPQPVETSQSINSH